MAGRTLAGFRLVLLITSTFGSAVAIPAPQHVGFTPIPRSANHALEPQTVGFTPDQSNTRSTMEIIWPCCTTILLCCYTAYHSNIPSRPPTFAQGMMYKLVQVLFTLLSPEVMTLRALLDLKCARKLQNTIKNLDTAHGNGSYTNISLKQAFFLGSGGFSLHLPGKEATSWLSIDVFIKQEIFADEISVHAREIMETILKDLPTDEEIDADSKSTTISKFITAMQALWVCAQIIGRLCTRLDVSLLEVLTASYIAMAGFAMFFWAKKPYGIGRSRVLSVHVSPHNAILLRGDRTLWSDKRELGGFEPDINDRPMDDAQSLHLMTFIVNAVLVAVHCAAWKYMFPTVVEACLWHVSAFSALIFPSLYFISLSCHPNWQSHPALYFLLCLGFVYYALRAYVILECFLSLRAAPVGIYDSLQWARYWPHIG